MAQDGAILNWLAMSVRELRGKVQELYNDREVLKKAGKEKENTRQVLLLSELVPHPWDFYGSAQKEVEEKQERDGGKKKVSFAESSVFFIATDNGCEEVTNAVPNSRPFNVFGSKVADESVSEEMNASTNLVANELSVDPASVDGGEEVGDRRLDILRHAIVPNTDCERLVEPWFLRASVGTWLHSGRVTPCEDGVSRDPDFDAPVLDSDADELERILAAIYEDAEEWPSEPNSRWTSLLMRATPGVYAFPHCDNVGFEDAEELFFASAQKAARELGGFGSMSLLRLFATAARKFQSRFMAKSAGRLAGMLRVDRGAVRDLLSQGFLEMYKEVLAEM